MKLSKSVLILLFSFLMVNMPQVKAAQIAIVRKPRAIIYADLDLKSPIGYVRKGKELAVGEVKRRRGEVLPVVVNGRVAWVRVSDISLPDELKSFDQDKKVTEHNLFVEEKIKDPLSENNYLTLRTGPASIQMTIVNTEFGEEVLDVENATETSLMLNHKNPYLKMHWGLGLEYVAGSVNFISYKSINLKGGMAWVPIRTKLLSIEAYANLTLSGDFRIISANIGTYKGNMYGLDGGAAIRLFPESLFGVVAGVGVTQSKLIDLEDIANDEDQVLTDVTALSGTKVFAGLSYRF